MTKSRGIAAPQSKTGARPIALFVLGLGRSGTSALTRVLSLCGATLPAALARLAGFDVAAVIALRQPQEAIASIAKHYLGASTELASSWWLKYTLLAERGTRGLPRVFVEYANLLDDWRRQIKRISAALAIDLDAAHEGAVEEFLTPDLRRQQHGGPVTEPFGADWISVAYEALGAAARNEPWDEAALDGVFEAYRASEHGFRTGFQDYRRHRKLDRLLRLSFVKLFLEVLARAHRRSGTWA